MVAPKGPRFEEMTGIKKSLRRDCCGPQPVIDHFVFSENYSEFVARAAHPKEMMIHK